MTEAEYEKNRKRLYNLRRTRAITYTEYEKRMAELEKAYENGDAYMLRVNPSPLAWNGHK